MKIKRLEIKNFRNIKYLNLELSRVSIITGKNNLGKSNTLNALNWLITNKLLTDKYGDGESDIQSVIPINAVKGETTEVSIWFENDTQFTKVFKRSYDKITGKASGHTTEYYVNGAKYSTLNQFYSDLYNMFDFKNVFTKLKIEEVRLFTDPLYALLKLDYKELRKLLVAIGCSVSNEELYQLGFEDLRQYESQYMGKWDVMRKAYKDKLKSLDVEIKEVESQIKMYSQIGEPDNSNLDKLQSQKVELINKKNELKNKGCYEMVSAIENQITKLSLELDEKRNNRKLEIQAQINEFELEKKNYTSNFEKTKFEASRGVLEQINNSKEQLFNKKNELSNLNLNIGYAERAIKQAEFDIKNSREKINDLSIKLGNALNNDDTMICPVCGSPIELHKEEHEKEISNLSNQITDLETSVEENEKIIVHKNTELEQLKNTVNEIKTSIDELETTVINLQAEKNNIEYQFKPDEEIQKISSKIFELQEKQRNINLEFEEENKAINELIERKNITLMDNQKVINEELQKIDSELFELDNQIKTEYENRHDYEMKVEKQKLYDVITKQYNDTESTLSRVNNFIHEMCKLINDKAKELTGFNFVMLEENLTNDGITETCYVVDDKGVPYKDINTARKVEMGIQFIDVVRKFNDNNLPILVDRLEGIDDISKIGKFTSKQVVCTRVSLDDEITVIKED